MRLVRWLPVLVATCGVSMIGCSLLRPSSSWTFFALSATDTTDAPIGSWDAVVGLGPIVIRDYLDRPQLVTRIQPNELRLDPSARWGEPLRDAVPRLLQQNLLAASGARRVVLYPWTLTTPINLAVALELIRFEHLEGDGVELWARWSIRVPTGGEVLVTRETRLTEPVNGEGAQAQVAALSEALAALAREITTGLRQVRVPGRTRDRTQ